MAEERIIVEQARAAIEAERRARIEACGKAIQVVLREHRCALDATVTISVRGAVPQIVIVAQD